MPSLLRASALAALAAGAIASDAWAQTHPSAHNMVGEVTVTGRRPVDEDMIRTVIAPFVASHAARDRVSGLLLRAPPQGLCAVTLGLPPAFDAFVTGRIVQVAKEVGAAVEPAASCRPNVEVLFASEPQTIVDDLAKRTGGRILGVHFVGETGGLIRVTRPVQAWYVTGTSGDSSSQDKVIGPDGTEDSEHAHVRIDRAYHGALDTGTGSLVPARNHSQFVNVLIVADARKVAGRAIGPIADYIVMLALSQARSLDTCGPLPSILDLMASGCASRPAPKALTEGDVAFLKALYAADLSASAGTARDKMVHGMAGRLAASSAAPSQ